MVPTTGATSPLVTLSSHTFSGTSPFVSEVPRQPKVSSPSLEKDIPDSPSTPMVMVLSPGPAWALFQLSPSIMSTSAPLRSLSSNQALWQCTLFLVSILAMPLKICIPSSWTLVSPCVDGVYGDYWVLDNQFIQPTLVHHQLALGSWNQLMTAVATAVTSDKLLLTMLTEKPQLQDTDPDTLRAACLQIFGLEPEQDLTLENPLKLDELNSPTLALLRLKDPVNSTNQRAGLAIDPEITWATTEGETENIPIERGPPRGNQSHNLTREFELSQFEPANEITPKIDATKDWENLVNGKSWANRICESLIMTDEHTYTLDHQENAHNHYCNKVT
ncbi:hypothetical protein DSO57_1013374 [Entomophthora muscae]|uniref:Uncharacterized protein n=1 Tax=Entomophthora muscae TaxID=34485 RepID=A0ACC2RKJ3_9FUNG|nr:hypothetical protein DSO57_1013374 [Entomophthora muscae]